MKAGFAVLLTLFLLHLRPARAAPLERLFDLADALAEIRQVSIARMRIAREEEPGFVLSGLELKLPERSEPAYRLRIARFAEDAKQPRLAPLRLDLTATPSGPEIRFSGSITVPGTAVRIRLEGGHDMARGRGLLRVDSGRIRFAPGGLQPSDLFPAFGNLLEEVRGSAGFLARLQWGERSRQLAELTIHDLSFLVAGIPVSGLRTSIAFDRLLPPSTLPAQEITIARIGAGLPLEEGRILFALSEGTRLAVARMAFTVAGGELRALPFTLELSRPETVVTLEARGLALETLLAHAGLPGLRGEGVLDGRLAARIAPPAVIIEEGRLAARGPGSLRYQPQSPPPISDPQMLLLLQAIRNFHFTRLEASVEGDLLDELRLTIGLSGSNPDFYEGYPVALNVTFEGPLGALLGSGIRAYRLPAEIERRLRKKAR